MKIIFTISNILTSSSFNKFLQTSIYHYLDQQHLTRTNYLLSLSLSLALPSACPRESKGGEGVTPRRRARARHATARAASGAFNARSLSSVRVPAVSKGGSKGRSTPSTSFHDTLLAEVRPRTVHDLSRAEGGMDFGSRLTERETDLYHVTRNRRKEKRKGKIVACRSEITITLKRSLFEM